MFKQTETKEIKRALVAEFGHPFSVRRDRGTASHWIQISWQDGPPETLVRQFTGKFNDTARDDIMTDLWCGGQYTSESREFSFAAYRWAVRQVEIEYTVDLPITVRDSWRENGEKTGYIKEGFDQIVDPDNPDCSQSFASSKVNRLLHETDFAHMDLTGFDWLPGEGAEVNAKSRLEISVTQDVPPEKKVEASEKREAHYARLRKGGRYNGLPKAATFWKEVLDATCGKGIRPNRRPGGGWCELEEFLSAVPPLLRNYKDGVPPDELAQDLDLEGGDNELYEKLRQDAHAKVEEEYEQMVEEDAEVSLGLELASISSPDGGSPEFVVFNRPEIKMPFSFDSSKDVYEKMKGYQKADREMFTLLFLNAKNVVLNIETHTAGAVNQAAVYPSQVFRSALLNNATSIICVHNHPSGDPKPSASDREITKELALCAHLLGVHLLDHIILGDDRYFSFSDEGLIGEYELVAKTKLDN